MSEGSKPGESGAEIRPVPEGYHTVTPWIISRDTARLIEFVREAFGAEEIARVHNEDGTIGHAEFRIGDSVVMGFDAKAEWPDTPASSACTSRMAMRYTGERWRRGHFRDRDDGPVLRRSGRARAGPFWQPLVDPGARRGPRSRGDGAARWDRRSASSDANVQESLDRELGSRTRGPDHVQSRVRWKEHHGLEAGRLKENSIMTETSRQDAGSDRSGSTFPRPTSDDLQDRLARTRWTNELPPDSRGPPDGLSRRVGSTAYRSPTSRTWSSTGETATTGAHGRAKLNAYPQFTTTIDGQNIHFLHVRSPEPDATPLILTHGWPNTVCGVPRSHRSAHRPARSRRDPADAFHVVIPSPPGFAFSGPTTETGWNAYRTAEAWAELMRRLGYDRYGAHGNDAGAIVAPMRAALDPDHVIGVHVNQIFSFPSRGPGRVRGPDPGGHRAPASSCRLRRRDAGLRQGAGVQAAEPRARAGRLARRSARLERPAVRRRAQPRRDPDQRLDLLADQHRGIGGPLLLRKQARRTPDRADHGAHRPGQLRLRLPADPQVRRTRPPNIVSWSEFDRGGHWAAHEAPDLLVDDIRQFFRRFFTSPP